MGSSAGLVNTALNIKIDKTWKIYWPAGASSASQQGLGSMNVYVIVPCITVTDELRSFRHYAIELCAFINQTQNGQVCLLARKTEV